MRCAEWLRRALPGYGQSTPWLLVALERCSAPNSADADSACLKKEIPCQSAIEI